MADIDTEFQLFKSIVNGLSKHLFPSGAIVNEASDVQITTALLNNKDVGKFLTQEFIDKLKRKLGKKAAGILKQAEIDREGFAKVAEFSVPDTKEENLEDPEDLLNPQY